MVRTVLVVDDAEACAALLEVTLAAIPDVEVHTVTSAAAALRWATAAEHPLAALVTDLELPRLDGFALIERIRAEPRHARLPVVVVSGAADTAARERLRVMGVEACFSKPYSPAAVRRALEDLLNAP